MRSNVDRLVSWMAVVVVIAIDWEVIHLLREPMLSRPARLAVALMPLPGDLTLIYLAQRLIRRLDEFQRRIQLEAVTIAFLLTGVTIFVYACLRTARIVGDINASYVWLCMLACYVVGYLVAASRYR